MNLPNERYFEEKMKHKIAETEQINVDDLTDDEWTSKMNEYTLEITMNGFAVRKKMQGEL